MSRITRIGLIGAVAGVLLAEAPALFEPFVIVKLVVLSAALTLAWIGLFHAGLRRTALDRPLAAVWTVMLLSAAVSNDWPVALFGRYPQLFYGLLPLGLCTAFYYAVATAPDLDRGARLLDAMLAASIPLSLYGISQRIAGDLLIRAPLPAGGRIFSTIGNPVMFGACLVPMVPVALHRSFDKRPWLGRLAGALLAVALLLTWARGAWISAGAAAALYLWLTGRVRFGLRPWQWLALGLCGLALFAGFESRFSKWKSDSMRIELLRSTWPMFASSPLLGWGPDNFLNAFRAHKTDGFLRVTRRALDAHPNAHNDLIQAAVTLGGLGLLAYAWLLWVLGARLKLLLSRARDREAFGEHAAIAAGLAGLFIQAKVNPIPLSALALAAVMLGIVAREPERAALKPLAGRAICLLAALFCAANALLWARWYAADREFRIGSIIVGTRTLADKSYMDGVNALRRANELNPWVIDYSRQRLDVIFKTAGLVTPEQGRQLLEKALAIATQDTRLHPGNSSSHEMRATALELMKRLGTDRLAEAAEEIKTASDEDPTALFTLRRRMEIARARGDRADFDRTLAAYRRVIGLTGEAPDWEPLLK